jgi:hypothetical protein
MRFEVSERIKTSKSQEELLSFLEAQFKKISESANRSDTTIKVKSIEASFGAINRDDSADISLKKSEDGWLLVADVNYKPSVLGVFYCRSFQLGFLVTTNRFLPLSKRCRKRSYF